MGQSQNKNLISFYAAAIGVMFLLFTASGSAGALLDEAESGTLDRVLSSRVTMTTLLAGKLTFNMLLAFAQLIVMFLWAWGVFHLDFFSHIPGFVVMGICTAFAVAAFGMLLASICHSRAQLGAVSTLFILIMSSIGGSMFPASLCLRRCSVPDYLRSMPGPSTVSQKSSGATCPLPRSGRRSRSSLASVRRSFSSLAA